MTGRFPQSGLVSEFDYWNSDDPYIDLEGERCEVCGELIGDFDYEDEPVCESCDRLNMGTAA